MCRQLLNESRGTLSAASFLGHPAVLIPDTERFVVVPVSIASDDIQQVAPSLIRSVQSALPEGFTVLNNRQRLNMRPIILLQSPQTMVHLLLLLQGAAN